MGILSESGRRKMNAGLDELKDHYNEKWLRWNKTEQLGEKC